MRSSVTGPRIPAFLFLVMCGTHLLDLKSLIALSHSFASNYKDCPVFSFVCLRKFESLPLWHIRMPSSTMDTTKANTENIENAICKQREDMPVKGMGPIMRSREDDLGIWQCVTRFKTVSWIAMAAAFSASLDGYRKSFLYNRPNSTNI